MLLVSGCLSDEGPLFTPIEVSEAPEGMPASAAEPSSESADPAQVSPVPEVLTVPALDVPAQPVTPAGAEAAAEGDEMPPAPAAVTPTGPCDADELLFCETFEAVAAGVYPEGEPWLPELSGCGTHVVDAAGPAVSGTNALRADQGAYPECMLHADVSGEGDLYVRSRVFLEVGGAERDQYLTVLEFGTSATRDDPELRIGVRPETGSLCDGQPGIDVTGSGLAAGPRTACGGFALEPERWYCIEAHLVRGGDGRDLGLAVSVDGVSLVDETFTGADAWNGSSLFLKVGRASYGASAPGAIWHDDIAVSRLPLPCEPVALAPAN